jgi:hypothetical protein
MYLPLRMLFYLLLRNLLGAMSWFQPWLPLLFGSIFFGHCPVFWIEKCVWPSEGNVIVKICLWYQDQRLAVHLVPCLLIILVRVCIMAACRKMRIDGYRVARRHMWLGDTCVTVYEDFISLHCAKYLWYSDSNGRDSHQWNLDTYRWSQTCKHIRHTI